MRQIWKFPIGVMDEQRIEMPEASNILCVQVQNGKPCLWAAVIPDAAKVKRIIAVYGTGHPMKAPQAKYYVGTFQLQDVNLVFHVYSD